jgi:serpin B
MNHDVRPPAAFLLLSSLLAFILSLGLAGCSKQGPVAPDDDSGTSDPFEVRQIPSELQGDLSPVVEGNTAFALDLYAHLATAEGNLFLSPYSISTALAMTWAGARGTTETEMAQVLHFSLDQEHLHRVFGAVQASLEDGSGLGGYELAIANRLWGRLGYEWLDDFLHITREDYGAELQEMDFTNQPEASRLVINQWVEDQTHGKIVDLFRPGQITSNSVLVLTNAIYFKGAWASPFDKELTQLAAFEVSPGVVVQTEMMQQHAQFPFFHDDEVTVLLMPYEGKDLSMVLLSPAPTSSLGDLEARLTPAALSGWLGSVTKTGVDVWLPRFGFTSEFRLNEVLADMGMPSAFANADFSGMNGTGGIQISAVVHKAFVEVNEEGTEAAAATGVDEATSVGATFDGTRPFLFLIYDHVTGSVLFLGRLADPTR